MIQSFFKLIKTLFVLAVLVFLAGIAAVFYFGYRLGDSTQNTENDVPAETPEIEVDAGGNAENVVGKPAAAKKPSATPEARAKAVLFELRVKKKTAQRQLKAAGEELTKLEKSKADGEKIAEVRERIASFEREIKNCDAAIEQANAALKNAKAEAARERESADAILRKLD